jgi:hypothetical protein
MHGGPLFGVALEAADAMAHLVVEDLGAAARDAVQARVAQPGDRVPDGEAADFGDVQDFGGGEAVQVNLKALLDRAQQILVPLDLQVRVESALHEDAGAAQLDGLLDLLEDDFLGQDVALGVAQRAVEGAEGAVLAAKVGVVDVAVDDVGDHAFGMQAPPDGVGSHADADEVGIFEQIDGFFVAQHVLPSSDS